MDIALDKYNKDNIPFYVSCPKKDKSLFENVLGKKNYTLVLDEDIVSLKYPLDGWRSQQVVKASLWKLNITNNYFSIDSDGYFIKDFYINDFIVEDDLPYTVIHDNKETQQYRKLFFGTDFAKGGYAQAVNAYRDVFGSKYKRIYEYGGGCYIWSCKVWKHLEENYLKPNSFDFETFNIMMEQQYNIQMREALVYGEYLFNTKLFEIVPAGPYFKVYCWKEMVELEKANGLFDEEKLKSNFLGIIYQSKI